MSFANKVSFISLFHYLLFPCCIATARNPCGSKCIKLNSTRGHAPFSQSEGKYTETSALSDCTGPGDIL